MYPVSIRQMLRKSIGICIGEYGNATKRSMRGWTNFYVLLYMYWKNISTQVYCFIAVAQLTEILLDISDALFLLWKWKMKNFLNFWIFEVSRRPLWDSVEHYPFIFSDKVFYKKYTNVPPGTGEVFLKKWGVPIVSKRTVRISFII